MPPKINQVPNVINSFLEELQVELNQLMCRKIEEQLEADVETWLYRVPHQRCCRCGSQQAQDFRRNGHRKRQLVTTVGVVDFWLPRVVCHCGGSVQIPFSILKPYQQIWADVELQVERWADLGLSLRQMQIEIAHHSQTQVGLCTLNQIVNHYNNRPAIELTSIPPVVMLDAIWVTLLQETGHSQPDQLKRIRLVKARQKVCVMVALGLYPQSQRWGILGWHVANSESQEEWEALLVPLEERGLYQQQGLALLIHDGGKGLIAALNLIYPTVPHQRCTFHKLRNLWHSIRLQRGCLATSDNNLNATSCNRYKPFSMPLMFKMLKIYNRPSSNNFNISNLNLSKHYNGIAG